MRLDPGERGSAVERSEADAHPTRPASFQAPAAPLSEWSDVDPWRRRASGLAGRPGSVRRPVAFLVIICAAASLLAPSFLTVNNLLALLTSSSFLIVLSVGEAVVILVGMIDLGVESVLSASGMLIAWLTVFHGIPAGPAVALTLAAGAAVGGIAGLLVARGGIPSFLVTLASYWGFRGVALLFNGGNYISPDAVSPSRPFGFSGIAGTIGGIPVLVMVALVVVIAAQLVVSFTPVGAWIRATGSNENGRSACGRTGSRCSRSPPPA